MFSPRDLSKYHDMAIFLLRIVVALVFLFHGTQKWVFWNMSPDGISSQMIALMRFLSIVEPLAAIGLTLGLYTQASAAGIALVMVSAMVMKWSKLQPFPKWELDLVLLAASLTLIVVGPGAHSLDERRPGKRRGWWKR